MGNFLSVIIPAYNEESRIGPTLERLIFYLTATSRKFEIIVVDDGSSDNTSSTVKKLGAGLNGIRLIHYDKNRGKGYAIRKGVLSSQGDLVLISDADLSTPIEEFEKLDVFIKKDFDIAIGSRGLDDSDIKVRQPWYRERMGKTFNAFVQLLIFSGIQDTQCGFKLFKGEVARTLFKRSYIDGFGFDVEILFSAKNAGYSIKEVPVIWFNSPLSRVRLVADPMKMFLDLIRIRLNWLSGKYAD